MAEDHTEVIKRMTDFWDADKNNREDALDDQKFRAGDQWNDLVRKTREAQGRPVLTINRMGQFVKRVSGSLRQSRPSIQPIAVDANTDKQLVEILSGLIRHIEYQSKAGVAYAYGAECAIACGIGWWQIKTAYIDGSIDQDICIERILDPLSVIVDSKSTKLDRSDADEIYVTEWVNKRDRKKRFPKADEIGNDLPISKDSRAFSTLYWHQEERTRVASRWWREPVKKKIGINDQGQVFDLTKLTRNAIAQLNIVRDRDADEYVVKHQVFDGDDFLTDVQPWAGRHIPLVACVGEEIAYDGDVIRHGVVRWAKDPQRLYNYWRTAAAEMIALAPKAPFIVPMKSIDGLENFWNQANVANLPYLPYNPLGDFPTLRPERAQAAQPPSAMWEEANVAQDDMKATTGIYDSALGAKSNESSGVAINARTNETDTGTFVYFDNFNHAIERTGTILVDLIPKIYDGERIVRVLGEDGKEGFVPINRTVMSLDGPVLINDLSAGNYDVRIKTGPSYANAKAQAKQDLTELVKADPNLMGVLADLVAESLDLPAEISGKIVDRIRRTINPAFLSPEEQQEMAQKSGPPPPPDPRQQQDVAMGAAKVAKEQNAADHLMLKNEKLAAELGLHPGAAPHDLAPPEQPQVPLSPMHTPPKETINFKDLPPEAQAQMLLQAGIHVHPGSLAQHAAMQAMLAMKPPPPKPGRNALPAGR